MGSSGQGSVADTAKRLAGRAALAAAHGLVAGGRVVAKVRLPACPVMPFPLPPFGPRSMHCAAGGTVQRCMMTTCLHPPAAQSASPLPACLPRSRPQGVSRLVEDTSDKEPVQFLKFAQLEWSSSSTADDGDGGDGVGANGGAPPPPHLHRLPVLLVGLSTGFQVGGQGQPLGSSVQGCWSVQLSLGLRRSGSESRHTAFPPVLAVRLPPSRRCGAWMAPTRLSSSPAATAPSGAPLRICLPGAGWPRECAPPCELQPRSKPAAGGMHTARIPATLASLPAWRAGY